MTWNEPHASDSSEANRRRCQVGYHDALNPLLPSYPSQPSSPTLTPLNPTPGPLSAGFRMSGVPVQSTRRDTGMCTKAVTASYCCQYWRLSSPQKSQLARCGCLIFNTTQRLLFPPLLTVFESRFEICKKKAWQGFWIRDKKTFIILKGLSSTHMATTQSRPQQYLCYCNSCLCQARLLMRLRVCAYQQQEEMGEVCCS